MKINVGCGMYPVPGWLNLDVSHPAADLVWDVTDGLPDVHEHVDRIYAGHVLEHVEHDLVIPMLESWLQNERVTTRTLLAIVGPDCDVAARWLAKGNLSQQEYDDMVGNQNPTPGESHLWRSTGAETARLVRDAGWGVASNYDLGLLKMDGWPVTSQIGWQFGLLCRAIK